MHWKSTVTSALADVIDSKMCDPKTLMLFLSPSLDLFHTKTGEPQSRLKSFGKSLIFTFRYKTSKSPLRSECSSTDTCQVSEHFLFIYFYLSSVLPSNHSSCKSCVSCLRVCSESSVFVLCWLKFLNKDRSCCVLTWDNIGLDVIKYGINVIFILWL